MCSLLKRAIIIVGLCTLGVHLQLFWSSPRDFVHRMMSKAKRNGFRRPQICYDKLGCFARKKIPSLIHKTPETPEQLETKFYMFYNRTMLDSPHVLDWSFPIEFYENFRNGSGGGGGGSSSSTNTVDQLKVLIHGYMGTWNAPRVFDGIRAYLKHGRCKVLVIDWQIGARGPQYPNAAANTEVIGRQLGTILYEAIDKWFLDANQIHLIGFSLGAHIAGCASEFLKNRGILIGRITGLDPAGPLFTYNLVKTLTKKLDKSDAKFVDVIHSDASLIFTDGFGIVHPIGHVDFFPNGGRQQPGCPPVHLSAVAINEDKACSHIRAWDLFYESILMQSGSVDRCQFLAYQCDGDYEAFRNGNCFPNGSTPKQLARMGETATGYGPQYLITKSKRPFCGDQARLAVRFDARQNESTSRSDQNRKILSKGRVIVTLKLNGASLSQIRIKFTNNENEDTPKPIYGLVALRYGLLAANLTEIETSIKFDNGVNEHEQRLIKSINFVQLDNLFGNSWSTDEINNHYSNETITIRNFLLRKS